MSAPVDVLRQVPLFADLDQEDLAGLANQMKERRYSEGSPMTSEGSGGAGLQADGRIVVGGHFVLPTPREIDLGVWRYLGAATPLTVSEHW